MGNVDRKKFFLIFYTKNNLLFFKLKQYDIHLLSIVLENFFLRTITDDLSVLILIWHS